MPARVTSDARPGTRPVEARGPARAHHRHGQRRHHATAPWSAGRWSRPAAPDPTSGTRATPSGCRRRSGAGPVPRTGPPRGGGRSATSQAQAARAAIPNTVWTTVTVADCRHGERRPGGAGGRRAVRPTPPGWTGRAARWARAGPWGPSHDEAVAAGQGHADEGHRRRGQRPGHLRPGRLGPAHGGTCTHVVDDQEDDGHGGRQLDRGGHRAQRQPRTGAARRRPGTPRRPAVRP